MTTEDDVPNLALQNRKEACGCARAGRGRPCCGGERGGLGVLLPPALHLGEPQASPHRLPQEDHPQTPLRPQQGLLCRSGTAEEAACPPALVMRPGSVCSLPTGATSRSV